MRHLDVQDGVTKGWLTGTWDSNLPISIGYATEGIDEPHLHPSLTEIYLIAQGTSRLRIGRETLDLAPGSVVIVDPGEAHTFLDSSPDYLHFVVHVPHGQFDVDTHKVIVDRSELAL